MKSIYISVYLSDSVQGELIDVLLQVVHVLACPEDSSNQFSMVVLYSLGHYLVENLD